MTDESRDVMDDALFNTIDALADEGEALLDDAKFAEAATKFAAAFSHVPSPYQDWEISIWLLTALGESHFLSGNYQAASDAFTKALECPDAEDSPPIHMRLGQAEFELGNKEKGAEYMLKAYEEEGEELFEDEDEKYLEYLHRVYELDTSKE